MCYVSRALAGAWVIEGHAAAEVCVVGLRGLDPARTKWNSYASVSLEMRVTECWNFFWGALTLIYEFV